jgi:hypothetical protein
MSDQLTRRRFVLRGMLAGGAVTVGLPLLDMFLDGNGTAMAASYGGGPLPARFGTWFWGCGSIPSRWDPKRLGADYDLPPQLAPIAPVRSWISVLSGFNVPLDGKGNQPHISGNTALRTGAVVESWQQVTAPTLDVLIADTLGSGSYFRSLDLSADGDPKTSYSFRSGNAMNASIPSALELYRKVFGADFQDPNAAEFHPDPHFMVRRSVLAGVAEQRRKLMRTVSAADRQRLDQYFESVRAVEQKLTLQLERPPRAEACSIPSPPPKRDTGTDVELRKSHHQLMAQLLATALACNQTRVFNMVFSVAASDLHRSGHTTGHHQSTHEELVDPVLGFQPSADYFTTRSMEAWAEFVAALAAIREGDGTLLDHCLVLAHSDVSYAKNHDVNGIPMMLAGRAGGRIRSGIHVHGGGEPVSRVGLTVQQVMGVGVESWGGQSLRSSRPISELVT